MSEIDTESMLLKANTDMQKITFELQGLLNVTGNRSELVSGLPHDISIPADTLIIKKIRARNMLSPFTC